jgi:hypothetical protein
VRKGQLAQGDDPTSTVGSVHTPRRFELRLPAFSRGIP